MGTLILAAFVLGAIVAIAGVVLGWSLHIRFLNSLEDLDDEF